MRSASLLALLATALILAAGAAAATNEIRLCGNAHGRQVAAGNYPQGNIPRTKCSFARATERRVHAREQAVGLRTSFRLRVRGQRLDCTWDKGSVEEIRCRNQRRFVLLYRYS
jgi:hypothetical protein